MVVVGAVVGPGGLQRGFHPGLHEFPAVDGRGVRRRRGLAEVASARRLLAERGGGGLHGRLGVLLPPVRRRDNGSADRWSGRRRPAWSLEVDRPLAMGVGGQARGLAGLGFCAGGDVDAQHRRAGRGIRPPRQRRRPQAMGHFHALHGLQPASYPGDRRRGFHHRRARLARRSLCSGRA
jgi:hypothetical protein